VLDVALLLGTQSGPDRRVPLALDTRLDELDTIESARATLEGDIAGLRVGWLGDLGDHLAMEDGVLDACRSGLSRLESLGCAVGEAMFRMAPDRVWSAWSTWRHHLVSAGLSPLITDPRRRELVKPEALWEIDEGAKLTSAQFARAARERTSFHTAMVDLFREFDLLVIPSAQVWPFPAEQRWPPRIGDRDMDTYHRWMEVSIYATFAGLPAISVPVGFDARGLPMGMQLIGPPRADIEVLRAAHAYERTISSLAVGAA
jgi:amidase